MCEGVYKETRVGQNMCLNRAEWRRKGKTPFFFPLHEIQVAKFQAFFLSCRRQFQFSDLSGQEQGLGFGVLVLQVNILFTQENSVSYVVLETFSFLQKQKDRKDQSHTGLQVSCFAAPSLCCTVQAQVAAEGA